MDWDATGALLMVNSGAKELLYFEAPKGKRQALSSKVAEQIEVSRTGGHWNRRKAPKRTQEQLPAAYSSLFAWIASRE